MSFFRCIASPLGPGLRLVLLVLGLILIGVAETDPLFAESGLYRGTDGSSGRITDLGSGIEIYSDAHGMTGAVLPRQGAGPVGPLTLPHGQLKPGTMIPFGAPAPPSNLTPAPVLPAFPHRLLPPQSPPTLAPIPAPVPGIQDDRSGSRAR